MEAFPQLNDHTEFECVVEGVPYHAQALVRRTLDDGQEILQLILAACPNPEGCDQ